MSKASSAGTERRPRREDGRLQVRDRGRRDDGERRGAGDPLGGRERVHRHRRRGAGAAVRAPAAVEGALDRPGGGLDLAAARWRASRFARARASSRSTAPRDRVALEGGETVGYERLLLATGGTPRRLPSGADGVVYYRTVADYRRVQALPVGKHVAVVGGGFIGSEMAASLATAGYRVTLVFPEEGIGARLFPRDLAVHLNGYYAEREVEVRPGERLSEVAASGSGFTLRTDRGEIRADLVVAGLGIVPNDALARGRRARRGRRHRRGRDAAHVRPRRVRRGRRRALPEPARSGGAIRVEHEDNANRMGREAGRAMAGADAAYRHLPFFYSDLFDLGYEAVGAARSAARGRRRLDRAVPEGRSSTTSRTAACAASWRGAPSARWTPHARSSPSRARTLPTACAGGSRRSRGPSAPSVNGRQRLPLPRDVPARR